MKTILIIILIKSNAMVIEHVEFASMTECEDAGNAIHETLKRDTYIKKSTICVPTK